MINTDRIVPITTVDLISMYGLIISQTIGDTILTAINAADTAGNFTIAADGDEEDFIANEPVKSINITVNELTSSVYFVPAYDFTGVTINGIAATVSGMSDEVVADGRSLYAMSYQGSNVVKFTKLSF